MKFKTPQQILNISSLRLKYTAGGALFGSCFPLLASAIAVYQTGVKLTFSNIIFLHKTNPLLWIIDTAPFWLALFFWLIAIRQEKLKNIISNSNLILTKKTDLLSYSEWKYYNLFNYSSDGILIHDLQGNIIDANQKSFEMFGYTMIELFKLNIMDLTHKKTKFESSPFRKQLIENNCVTFESLFKRKNGENFPCEVSSSLIRLGSKDIVQAIMRDITERKHVENELRNARQELEFRVQERTQDLAEANESLKIQIQERRTAEELLKKSEQKYRLLINQASDAICLIDTSGCFLEVNKMAEKISGYSAEELLQKNIRDLIPPDHLDRVINSFNDFIQKDTMEVDEICIIDKNGNEIETEISGSTIDHYGQKIAQAIIRDITARKKQETELRKFKTISDQANYGTAIADLDGKLLYVNSHFAQMHGYAPQKLINKNLFILQGKSEQPRLQQIFSEILEKGSVHSVELWPIRKDHSRYPALVSATLIKDDRDKPFLIAASMIDISELKKAEQIIRNKLNFEKYASTISSRFVGVTDIDVALNESLADLSKMTGASRAYIFLFDTEQDLIHNTHEWCAPDIESQKYRLQNLSPTTLPWWMQKLQRGETIQIDDGTDIPEDAGWEKEYINQQQIRSLLIMPLYISGHIAGFIGFEHIENEIAWREEDLKLLKLSSEIFGNAFEQKLIEQKLTQRSLDLSGRMKELNCLYSISSLAATPKLPLTELFNKTVEIIRTGWQHPEKTYVRIVYDGEVYKCRNFKTTRIKLKTDIRIESGKVGTLEVFQSKDRSSDDETGCSGYQQNLIEAIASRLSLSIEQRESHNALKESKEKYQLLLENQKDLIIKMDGDGRLLFVSPSFCDFFNKEETEVLGQKFDPLIHKNDFSISLAALKRVYRPPHSYYVEYRVWARSMWKWLGWIDTAVLDENGEVIAVIGVGRDITERKRVEAELERIHADMIQISRQAGMAEMATDVLHNVGNVLNSINVSATIIQNQIAKSELQDLKRAASLIEQHAHDIGHFIQHDERGRHLPNYIIEALRQLDHERQQALIELNSLIQNIEHIKKIILVQQSTAQKTSVFEPTPVVELVESALRLNESTLIKNHIRVIRKFRKLPLIETDRHKVLQILINLIRNANHAMIKMLTKKRELEIKLGKKSGNKIFIRIRDNGEGIPRENLTRIFSHGYTTRKGGHGFGLHSAALIAKELGGALKADSDGLNKGAVFTVELPIFAPNQRFNTTIKTETYIQEQSQ